MNFLMRSTTGVYAERTPIPEQPSVGDTRPRSVSGSSLETLVSGDPYAARHCGGDDAAIIAGLTSRNELPIVPDRHLDVSEEEGWITIPCKELPENWNHVPDIQSLCSLDRSFLFPGEQLHILACLSACKQDTDIISPFEVAAVVSKNGIGQSPEKENGKIENRNSSLSRKGELSTSGEEHLEDVTDNEYLRRMEFHKRQTALLRKFENSHFFVRICESDEPLWSKRGCSEKNSSSSEVNGIKAARLKIKETALSSTGAVIDRGNFDATMSGGLVRNAVKCYALPNGDIVVLLQVNVGVDFIRDPCIEILQFEKCPERIIPPDHQVNAINTNGDPFAELLNWILPLDNTLSPRLLSSPNLTSNTGDGSNFSASSGSQLFSFGNFRSYSMSSLPQSTSSPATAVKAASSKTNFDLENPDQISSQKFFRRKTALEGLLSFRGFSLERERFSVCCGLEGIHAPGRRWRRKLEIIQPVEIHSFAADCNSEDLLCVQIKNVAPENAPDIVIFIDAISIVLEEATKNGSLSSLLISCIEAGNDHSLPNLALRRGEEHSFVLKPAISMRKSLTVQGDRGSQISKTQFGKKLSKLSLDGRKIALNNDQYAIVVSCRCNYTASRLLFKQPTGWRPPTSKDIMISVVSEMSGKSPGPNATIQLPVQILTIQAANLTSEDLTLTLLAPASFNSPPSVVSINSPKTPMSPFVGFAELLGRVNGERSIGNTRGQSFTSIVEENEKQCYGDESQAVYMSDDVVPSCGLSCTHLWLQSKVPLGCIPSHSIATIKLELLPLTEDIITLDSLQIDVKEKGVTYIPERSLKISATSSISKEVTCCKSSDSDATLSVNAGQGQNTAPATPSLFPSFHDP